MKTKFTVIYRVTFLVLLAILHSGISSCLAQGTAFTYQGRLSDGANVANGTYDLRFAIYDAVTVGTQQGSLVTNSATVASNGLFTVTLDFGNQFPGANRWLEIGVRTNGAANFFTLSPRQALTPAPYAIMAGSVIGGGLSSGTYGNAFSFDNAANSFSGSFSGNGINVTNVNAATLGGLGADQFWKSTGNSNTVAGANYLGTADNQPLELKVGGQRGLRLEPTTNSPNFIGGFSGNYVSNGVTGASIGGGGAATVFGGNGFNRITDDYGVVGGGADNRAGNTNADPTDACYATVGGGVHNLAEGVATFVGGGAENRAANNNSTIGGGYQNNNSGYISSIGGGRHNFIGDQADQSTIGGGAINQIIGSELNTVASTIGGGYFNIIQTNVSYSTIAGGAINNIQEGSFEAAIGGGYLNVILTNSPYCTIGGGYGNHAGGVSSSVPGGYQSEAQGSYSFAAGRQAKANHDGAFVWADSQAADFASTATNQFSVRAAGGVRLVTSGAGMTLDGQSVALRTGGNNFGGQQTITGSDATQLIVQNSADSRFWFIYDEHFNNSGNLIFQPNTGVGAYIRRSDGNYIVNSDARLKQDISSIGDVLERVLKLRPVSYHFRSAPEGSPLSLGLIAQDVEPLFPEVVDEHGGMKSLAYTELIPVTIRAVQELNQKMDAENSILREELKRRDAENAELKQRLEALERIILNQKLN